MLRLFSLSWSHSYAEDSSIDDARLLLKYHREDMAAMTFFCLIMATVETQLGE
jgi:hypothetical protein